MGYSFAGSGTTRGGRCRSSRRAIPRQRPLLPERLAQSRVPPLRIAPTRRAGSSRELVQRRLRVENAAHGVGRDDPRHADHSKRRALTLSIPLTFARARTTPLGAATISSGPAASSHGLAAIPLARAPVSDR